MSLLKYALFIDTASEVTFSCIRVYNAVCDQIYGGINFFYRVVTNINLLSI